VPISGNKNLINKSEKKYDNDKFINIKYVVSIESGSFNKFKYNEYDEKSNDKQENNQIVLFIILIMQIIFK